MRDKLSSLLLIILCSCIVSCHSGDLSRNEAQRQIAELESQKKSKTNIEVYNSIGLYSGGDNQGLFIEQLQKQGYINFKTSTTIDMSWNTVHLVESLEILDKGKQYVTSDNGRYYFKVGEYLPSIVSMSIPAADATGSIVCNVEYADSIILNALGNEIEFKFEKGRDNKAARFVKMQDGWKLQK